jgi:hypothetical protein
LHAPGAGRSAERARSDLLEAEVLQQRDQRAAGVEAQVIRARIEARLERAPPEAERESREALVGRRAEHERTTRAQHAAHLREPAGGVRDVLDHLPGPDDVEAHVRKRPRSPGIDEAHVDPRVALTRAAQRLRGDVDPHRLAPGPHQLAREAALGAADVEHARSRGRVLEQEGQARRHMRGLLALRDALPKGLVMLVRGHLLGNYAVISSTPTANPLTWRPCTSRGVT